MNAILILMGLLVLSYLGSFLMTGRTVGGVGLPSGVEYAALGFVLGPHALDLVGGDSVAAFEPVVEVALGGWRSSSDSTSASPGSDGCALEASFSERSAHS